MIGSQIPGLPSSQDRPGLFHRTDEAMIYFVQRQRRCGQPLRSSGFHDSRVTRYGFRSGFSKAWRPGGKGFRAQTAQLARLPVRELSLGTQEVTSNRPGLVDRRIFSLFTIQKVRPMISKSDASATSKGQASSIKRQASSVKCQVKHIGKLA